MATITGTPQDDVIDVGGSAEPHRIDGLGGFDRITGSLAGDVIDGGNGDDWIDGGSGDDTITGGNGRDTLIGGGGDDRFLVDGRSGFDSVRGGSGFDRILGGAGDDEIGLAALSGVEEIDGGGGSNFVLLGGGGVTVDLSGTTLRNIDWVEGGNGNDTIVGTAADDRIAGGRGNDAIDGGGGTDRALYSGNFAQYLVRSTADGLEVDGMATGDGIDRLRNVEILEFADGRFEGGVFIPTSDPNNAPPVAAADNVSLAEDGSVLLDLLANDSDPDGDPLRIAALGTPAHGSAALQSDGRVRYTPAADFNGADSFTYRVEDGRGGAATATVSVSVTPVADTPVAANDSASTTEGQAVRIAVLANDTDADGDALVVSALGEAANGSVALNADGSLTYTPNTGFSGSDSFTYTAADPSGRTDTASVTVSVGAETPPPSGDPLFDIIAAAPEGEWIKLNINEFQDVWAPKDQRVSPSGFNIGSPDRVISAWSSMAYDPNANQLIFFGGGHANYGGNEIYTFNLNTFLWERGSLPSEIVNPFGDGIFFTVDGPFNAPISAHTYDNQLFLPKANRFVTFGGAKFSKGQIFVLEDGATQTGPYFWDPSKADPNKVGGTTGSHVNPSTFPSVVGAEAWENRNSFVNAAGPAPDLFVNGTTAYAFENGKEVVYVSEAPRTGGDLFRYVVNDPNDASQDEWQLAGKNTLGYAGQGAGAYDPGRRLFVRTAKVNGVYGFVAWDLTTEGPANASFQIAPTDLSGGAFQLDDLFGIEYDTVREAFVLWDGSTDVWYLRPPGGDGGADGWTIERAPPPGLPGGPQQSDGIRFASNGKIGSPFWGVLGKWEYVASHDIFLGVIDPDSGDVWAYKPEGWKPPLALG